jgi:hypothetical protein
MSAAVGTSCKHFFDLGHNLGTENGFDPCRSALTEGQGTPGAPMLRTPNPQLIPGLGGKVPNSAIFQKQLAQTQEEFQRGVKAEELSDPPPAPPRGA